ncbi:multiple sugar transport system substrate-binding protein [Streptomyces sp. LamerLS-316]|uniref:extracellular solute-binding protein n=1 Tax=unclassified Streptomyces TaxID=2593676 RepID=UPI000823A008|nr:MULTISPECIES: extracellular solute-binding protein [unclassified Streptomyces]MYQ40478.1 extracellular solute-binding protein [Streptomyces sp. SID4921]SCK15736.1 multiple sugar transport system substrate-binding protein [Streptomyces sp. LamerLS-316]
MTRTGRRPGRRRVRAALALGCLLALVSAACTGGSGGTHGPQEEQAAEGPIVVASGLDVTGSGSVRQQLIEEWNRRHAGSKAQQAKLVELPGGADQQRSQLLGALQSGSARYDVVNLDITWIPEFAEAGLIRPLPVDESGPAPDDDRDFIRQVHATTVWKGRSYARPFNTDVGLLYYRPDLLTEADIDVDKQPNAHWTWDQLYSSVKTLGLNPVRRDEPAGWTSQLKQYEGLTVNTVEAFADAGVELTDSEGKYSSDAKELKKGLDALLDRVDRGRVQPAALTSDETASLTDFAEGRAVFLRHWPYAYGALGGLMDPRAYSVNRLPGKAVLGGQNLAVTADSPRAENARALITFLTSRESERCLLDAGFAATRASAYGSSAERCWPRVAAALPPAGDAPKGEGVPKGEGAPKGQGAEARAAYIRILGVALTEAVQRPRTPYYGAFTQALQSHVHALLAAERPDTAEAAGALDKALRDVFAGR